ncbi:MAG TPA: hypothetical protein DCR55_17250 [Lentisphaeria bacterium]|nr:hypothetical protein [Lentisphaeria bacterium]
MRIDENKLCTLVVMESTKDGRKELIAVKGGYRESRSQRCWVHKTANILDKLPKKLQPKAKGMIHEMYLAETKTDALASHQLFFAVFAYKYPGAGPQACLRGIERLLQVKRSRPDYQALRLGHNLRGRNRKTPTSGLNQVQTHTDGGPLPTENTIHNKCKLLPSVRAVGNPLLCLTLLAVGRTDIGRATVRVRDGIPGFSNYI